VDGCKATYTSRLGDLPAGVMVAAQDDDAPHLIWQGQLWRWDFTGYSLGPQWPAATQVRVLTPRPTVGILAAGYSIQVYPSLLSQSAFVSDSARPDTPYLEAGNSS
jgi:hypothetical protein